MSYVKDSVKHSLGYSTNDAACPVKSVAITKPFDVDCISLFMDRNVWRVGYKMDTKN